MTPVGRGERVAEVVWGVRVEPADGGGYLTEFDVGAACRGIPDGASVDLALAEFDDFSGAPAGVLARRLASVQVRVTVLASARVAGAAVAAMFDRTQHHHLAAEAEALAGRSA